MTVAKILGSIVRRFSLHRPTRIGSHPVTFNTPMKKPRCVATAGFLRFNPKLA